MYNMYGKQITYMYKLYSYVNMYTSCIHVGYIQYLQFVQ